MTNLTSATGILSEKTGSSSDTNVLELTAASNSAVAGTHTVVVTSLAATSSGYLAEITNASDKLAGSIAIQVGSGTVQTIAIGSSNNTLAGLASSINSAGLGVTAAVLTDASGSRLSIVSGTSGTGGNLTITSSVADTVPATLKFSDAGYTTTTADSGTLASVMSGNTLSGSIVIQVGGGTATTIALSSSDNTISGLKAAINTANIGVTASIITNSDGTSSLSLASGTVGAAGALAVTSSVVNSTPPLAYENAVSGANASLTVDGVNLTTSSNTVSGLIPGLTFQLLSTSDTPVQVVIANYNSGVEGTVNSLVTDYNSLISAMNVQDSLSSSNTVEPLYGSPTLSMLQQDILGGINLSNPNGYIDAVSNSASTTLSGSIAIQVGTAAAQTFTLSSGDNSIAGLAAAINAKSMGVTASVVTANGSSSLTFASQTAGANGALTISSALVTSAPTSLTYSMLSDASGTLGSLAKGHAGDTLSGSISVAFGTNAPQTITLDSSDNTLAGLTTALAGLGVTATSITNSDGSQSLQLVSSNGDANGSMSVNSSLVDSVTPTTKTLNYNASSDIGALSGLGISINPDGTLSLDVNSLDSVLNADYSGVQGLFQNANSWGYSFNQMLTNAGNTASTGITALAVTANSSIESTLNADISREDALISSETKSLTSELNSANEILQELPSQLSQVNELYSAITGYNQSSS
jgi:flagellar hook-associated protein 2